MYCPACKRKVGKRLTNGQLMVMLSLYFLLIIPGIVYSVIHIKKCPICGHPTQNELIRKLRSK